MRLSIYYTHHSLSLKCGALVRKEILQLDRRRRLLLLGFYCFGVDSISEEVTGFSPLWFPREKLFVSLVSFDVLVFDCCTCYSLSKYPNIMLA